MKSKKSGRCVLKAIDLFAGCGGLTTGLKRARFKVLAAVEIDSLAAKTYSANHPKTVVWNCDIRMLSATKVMNAHGLRPGELDLLAGCPPCQGFSTMRTRNGSRANRDPQNGLLREFIRFIRVLRPKTIMLENVPRLASSSHIRPLRRVLTQLGYSASSGVLNAAHFGVPQRRKRFILIAARGVQPAFAMPSSELVTVRKAIGRLPHPKESSDPLHADIGTRAKHVMDLIREIPKNGGSRAALPKRLQLACHRRVSGFADVYGRMAWNEVAPTITGSCINPSKGRFLHPTQNRAITLREAAMLQSFPEKYHFSLEGGKYAVAQMIGNALPSEFIRRHAESLRVTLTSQKD